jgi:hypothetical protein
MANRVPIQEVSPSWRSDAGQLPTPPRGCDAWLEIASNPESNSKHATRCWAVFAHVEAGQGGESNEVPVQL